MREFSKHIDTWNIITLAFFGKTGWYYYWGNNTLLITENTFLTDSEKIKIHENQLSVYF